MDSIQELEFTSGNPDRPPYTESQALDPLGVDRFMQILPDLTRSGQLDVILNKLRFITENFDQSNCASIPHCFAALRDFDFLITSAHVLGANSYKGIQRLQEILEVLGRLTDHNPRGCNFTYGLFNPEDDRMRTFTGLNEERIFIHAIQKGTKGLDDSLLTLKRLSMVRVDSRDFEYLTDEITIQFAPMLPAVVEVLRKITPEVFSRQIVRFFVPLDINGKTYPGITGAQIQNVCIDLIVYGANSYSEQYYSYAARSLASMLPFQQSITRQILQQLQQTSLLNKIERDIALCENIDSAQAITSLNSLQRFLRKILRFRWAHRRLAQKNLPLRKKELGSGGYALDLLDDLIQITRIASLRIDQVKADLSIRNGG